MRGLGPLAVAEESRPEPDVAVVPGSFRDYVDGHPSRPALVLEVSESRLAVDREHKGSLYARAGFADHWIVNLIDRVLEAYRDPGRVIWLARPVGDRARARSSEADGEGVMQGHAVVSFRLRR